MSYMQSRPLLDDVEAPPQGCYGAVVPTGKVSQGSEAGSSGYEGTCLTHIRQQPPSNFARNKLLLAAGICLGFTITEALGGYFSNSLAIFTDASHMTVDFISYFISITALWIAKQPETKKMSYGWHRAEVIGAVLSVFTIWIITGILVYLAVGRLINQDYELEPDVMLLTASLGVLVNIVMGLVLMPEDIWNFRRNSDDKVARVNINVRAAFIHVVGDLVQSLGVLVAAVIVKIRPDWKLADPICTFAFAILVLFTTISILRDAVGVLMEGVPQDIDPEEISERLRSIEGVVDLHSLHIWNLTMDKNVLTVHLAIEDDSKYGYAGITRAARDTIHASASFYSVTVQIEPASAGHPIRTSSRDSGVSDAHSMTL